MIVAAARFGAEEGECGEASGGDEEEEERGDAEAAQVFVEAGVAFVLFGGEWLDFQHGL